MASRDAVELHALRTRVVDLAYQFALFEPAWPEMMRAEARELHRLQDDAGRPQRPDGARRIRARATGADARRGRGRRRPGRQAAATAGAAGSATLRAPLLRAARRLRAPSRRLPRLSPPQAARAERAGGCAQSRPAHILRAEYQRHRQRPTLSMGAPHEGRAEIAVFAPDRSQSMSQRNGRFRDDYRRHWYKEPADSLCLSPSHD